MAGYARLGKVRELRNAMERAALLSRGELFLPGTPQGGMVSPVLANSYLHYALDLWFERRVKKASRGDVFMIRFADDFVCAFQYRNDAVRFESATF